MIDSYRTEFTSNATLTIAGDSKIYWHYVAPEKPTRNAFIDRFSAHPLDVLSNETLFTSVYHARFSLAIWLTDYITELLHSRLGGKTHAAFNLQRDLTPLNPQSSSTVPFTHPTHANINPKNSRNEPW